MHASLLLSDGYYEPGKHCRLVKLEVQLIMQGGADTASCPKTDMHTQTICIAPAVLEVPTHLIQSTERACMTSVSVSWEN